MPTNEQIRHMAAGILRDLHSSLCPLALRAFVIESRDPAAEMQMRVTPGIPVGFQIYMTANNLSNIAVGLLMDIQEVDEVATNALKGYTGRLDEEGEDVPLALNRIRTNVDRMIRVLDPKMHGYLEQFARSETPPNM
jgi:hypothetical protein